MLQPNITVNGQPIVKIGMTTRSVEARVKQLQTGSPVAFQVAYAIEADDARALERRLHRQFADRRLLAGGGTEYFQVTSAEVIAAIEAIATEVSTERAKRALAADLLTYKMKIGAYEVENRIGNVGIIATLAAIVGIGYSMHLLSGFLAFLVFLVESAVAVIAVSKLTSVLKEKFFTPRFGLLLSQKTEELERKYPLARPHGVQQQVPADGPRPPGSARG